MVKKIRASSPNKKKESEELQKQQNLKIILAN